jgi:hypothetical protein
MTASYQTGTMRIMDGIETKKPEIHFPGRFSLLLKLLTLFPSRLHIRLCGKIVTQP